MHILDLRLKNIARMHDLLLHKDFCSSFAKYHICMVFIIIDRR